MRFQNRLVAACLLGLAFVPAGARGQIHPDLYHEESLDSSETKYAGYGGAVAIDGDTMAVSRSDLTSSTAVQVYQRQDGLWKRSVLLSSPGGDGFGSAIDIDGDLMVIGASEADNSAGVARVFERSGTNWIETAMLAASDRNTNDTVWERFGSAVAVDGSRVAVSAPGKDNLEPFSNDGAIYVFDWDGTNWIESQKLIATNLPTALIFGDSLALEQDTLVAAGVPYGGQGGGGEVRVFMHDGLEWYQQQTLTPSGGESFEKFGASFSLQGDRLAVGPGFPDQGQRGGGVYIFEREDHHWIQRHRITSPNAHGFGNYVVLHNSSLLALGGELHNFVLEGEAWVEMAETDLNLGCCVYPKAVAHDGSTLVVGFDNQWNYYHYANVFEEDFSDPAAVTQAVRKMLYVPDAGDSGYLAADRAAFRYKSLLYGEDPEATNRVRPRFELMDTFYGSAERARVDTARAILGKGLQAHPADVALGNLVLDTHYDQAVAEAILVKSAAEAAGRARIGPPVAPPAGSSGFIIDNEIPLYRDLLDSNRAALEVYLQVLTEDLGLPGEPPAGFVLFRDLVPDRALQPATYQSNGVPVEVTQTGTLYDGYKDLVLLFDLLRDYGRCASQLVELLVARNAPGDWNEASAVLTENQQRLLLQGNMLLGLFPALPPESDPSGLSAAIAGWRAALARMEELEQALRGEANLLGFAPDFLMLIENFDESGTQIFDSFDVLSARLSTNALQSPLVIAQQKLELARDTYADYRGFEDQLAAQFEDSTITYRDRLRDIVGVFPGDPGYGENPTDFPGSELDQQYRSIQLAELQIRRNATEISNLNERVQIELSRVAAVSNVVVEYGNKQARLTETMAHINATQAGADALADGLSLENLLTGRSVGIVVNAAVQAGAEEWKGQLEADKERLAATEQAIIQGIESEALVKSMLLEMNTLLVDTDEAVLLLQQEVARLAGLYREKRDLEARLQTADSARATRYFADPVHRLAVEANVLSANLAFNEARRWLFFALRALEYKWNLPFREFEYPEGGRVWSNETLFKLRNADELADFLQAMQSFDALINRGTALRFDWFSVREDFLNLKALDENGQPAVYTDPLTGREMDALSLFRTNLLRRVERSGNNEWVELEFSTVRQIPGGFFFVGPIFNADGTLATKGRFLDKIDYLQIRLPGSHTLGRSQLAGNLTYGGTSFIRNFNVGEYDPARPDRLRNEMTPYSTRYWFYDPTPGQMRWRFTEGLTIENVEMQLSADDRIPPTVLRIEEFKERSVAATGWKLRIPTISLGVEVLRVSELNDIEIYFHHYSAQRQ